MDLPNIGVQDAASILLSALVVGVTYSQYRIQSREFRPDLTVPKVAHYRTIYDERDAGLSESQIENDEVLLEITNLGNGTATQVNAESKMWVIETGSEDSSPMSAIEKICSYIDDREALPPENSETKLVERFQTPQTLTLDIAREDVFHSNWTETMEETVPGSQTETGYIVQLHVWNEDQVKSLDELLTENFSEKTAFRLQIRLVYSGRIECRDKHTAIVDSVIFPGICDGLGEAMAAEMPFSRYNRKTHEKALIKARADVERYREG